MEGESWISFLIAHRHFPLFAYIPYFYPVIPFILSLPDYTSGDTYTIPYNYWLFLVLHIYDEAYLAATIFL